MVKATIQFIRGVFLLVLLSGSQQLFSQIGYPIITNYSSTVIGATAQIWGIEQDKNGHFYFATNTGVVKFNGVDWIIYPVPLNSAVRSLAINQEGIVFVGATREFGFLKPNSKGKFEYVSLSDSLAEKNFSVVLKTFVIDNAVYFMANHEKIFKYENDSVYEINTNSIDYYRSFVINKEIWLTNTTYGIVKLTNDKPEPFYDGSIPGDLYFIIPQNGETVLAGTLKNGLFQFNTRTKQWQKFESEANEQLISGNIYHATALKSGNIAISTLKKGIFVISPNGKIKYVFNKQTGLINNASYYLCEDVYNDLWIAQEKGISHVELGVPFNRYSIHSGLDGNIQKLAVYNNNLYCGTSSGIYYLPLEESNKWNKNSFSQLSPDYIYNLDYCQITIPKLEHELLLASFLRELVVITPDNKLESIYKVYGCYTICKSQYKEGRIYIGSAAGIEVLDLEYENESVKVAKAETLKGINESVRKIICAPNGELWVQSAFNTIYKVSFSSNESLVDYSVEKFDQLTKTYPGIILTGLYKFYNKIYVTSNYGIYSLEFNKQINSENPFMPDLSMGLDFKKDSLSIQALTKDEFGNFWIASSIGILKYDVSKDEILMADFKRLQGRAIQSIFFSYQTGISFISEEEIYILHPNYSNPPDYKFKVVFSEAEFGTDFLKINFDGVFESKYSLKKAIPKDQNSFSIKFGAPFYQKNDLLKYSYKLEGFDKHWSSTSSQRIVNYTNLPSGNYIFKVKAENVYNIVSDEAELLFTISPAWYQKPLALLSLIIMAVLIIWMFVYLYTLNLKKEKKKLQSIIKEAIRKEAHQKEEIEKQAGRLYLANMELQKLSLVASKTDNGVVIMDCLGNIEWINEGYTRLFGFSFSDLVNKKTNLLGEQADVTINDMVNVWFGDKKPILFENQKQTKKGNKLWVQTTLTPILDENKNLKNLIAIETDITKLKMAEAEIESQKDEIEAQRDLALNQRDEITIQNNEIIDSILYAQRIQYAVFNKETDLKAIFKNYFVYNKPRDIVSGDFFWVHQINDIKIIAAVDCTGHGIPGAFMSLIGVTFLNNIIKEKGELVPFKILNQLRDKIISSLGQKGEEGEAKDGMDISICVIDTNKKIITYAAANNRSYLVRNNVLIEFEPDKMPISIYISAKQSFTQKEYTYKPGDILYLFSDGYSDQFGGTSGKKFKSSKFKQLIQQISIENFANQKAILEIEYQKWKEDLAQVDDILVIGIGLE